MVTGMLHSRASCWLGLWVLSTGCGVEVVEHVRTRDAGRGSDGGTNPDATIVDARGADAQVTDGAAPDAAPTDGGLPVVRAPICSGDHWCWDDEARIQGNELRAVWASASNDVWAVGAAATILHFDGQAWSGQTQITGSVTAELYAISGSGPADVWAVGERGTILHWDGTRWGVHAAPGSGDTLRGVYAWSPRLAWAVGDRGTILRWDGTSWQSELSPTQLSLAAVWAASSSDVVAVGERGTVVRDSGRGFQTVASGTMARLVAVWGSSASDVYAARGFSDIDAGGLLRFDGAQWSPAVGAPTDYLAGLTGRSATDVWAVTSWVQPHALWHFDGTSWSSEPLPEISTPNTLAVAGDEIWIAGPSGAIASRGAGGWRVHASGSDLALQDVFGFAEDALWAVGRQGTILRRGSRGWQPETLPTPNGDFYGVWGSRADDVWAVGNPGLLFHFDGARWSSAVSPVNDLLKDVWGTGPSDVWAIGVSGSVLRFDGTSWTVQTTFTSRLNGVWAAAPNEVWVAAFGGAVHVFDGNQWRERGGGSGGENMAIHGSGVGGGVWATGFGGLVSWNGVDWQNRGPTGGNALWSFGPVAWQVGDGGAITKADGGLIDYESGCANRLQGVFFLDGSRGWAVGDQGTILRRQP